MSRLGFTAAEMAECDAALDAALKLSDDPYAPRSTDAEWVSDPYAAELADAEDYAGAHRAAELEGAL